MSHSHGGPTADVSVRIAWADDAASIAGVQVRAWPALYAGVLPAELLPTNVDDVAAQWRQALVKPADARHRVLVALERNRVVGFSTYGEQFNGMHVNQTMTGVAIFAPEEDD